MEQLILSMTELPNLHPALVHFPIAFLPLAIFFEAAGLAFRRQDWLDRAATAMFGAAALGALVARWAGLRAADGLTDVPAKVQLAIAEHSDFATRTVWTLVALALLRAAVLFTDKERNRRWQRAISLVLAAGAMGLVGWTADLGGGLVFRHGVGVAGRVGVAPVTLAAPEVILEVSEEPQQLIELADGTIVWRPTARPANSWQGVLTAVPGVSTGSISQIETPEAEDGLTLLIAGRSLLTLPGNFSDVEVEATVELLGFDGTIAVGYHVDENGDGGFFSLAGDEVSLFLVRGPEQTVLGRESVEPFEGAVTLAVSVAKSRHLKGIVEGRTLIHQHSSSAKSGAVGLLLDGNGIVRLTSVKITPLGDPS